MDNKWIILIIIVFVGVIGYIYITTPHLEVDNFIVEKHTETINYVSGDVKKTKVITSNFTIIQGHANRLGIKGNYILYDEFDNVIDNSTFEQSDAPYEFSYYWDNLDDANKVKKVELILYNIENCAVLYQNNTTDIQKGVDTVDEIDDTIDWSEDSHDGPYSQAECMGIATSKDSGPILCVGEVGDNYKFKADSSIPGHNYIYVNKYTGEAHWRSSWDYASYDDYLKTQNAPDGVAYYDGQPYYIDGDRYVDGSGSGSSSGGSSSQGGDSFDGGGAAPT